MDNELVKISTIGSSTDKIKLTPVGSGRDIALTPCILYNFEQYQRQNFTTFIIDLRNLHDLPPGLIVTLFELAARARRKGGEVYLQNLRAKARYDLLAFDPLSFLKEAEDRDFSEEESKNYSILHKSGLKSIPNPERLVEMAMTKDAIEIPSKVDELYKACDFVVDFAKEMGFSENVLGKIKIAVYEACLNAIEHAYHSNPRFTVVVEVENKNGKLIVSVIDQGEGFEANTNSEFDIAKAVDMRKTGGMGLHIIRQSMDSVQYKMDAIKGNRLVMMKELNGNGKSNGSGLGMKDYEN